MTLKKGLRQGILKVIIYQFIFYFQLYVKSIYMSASYTQAWIFSLLVQRNSIKVEKHFLKGFFKETTEQKMDSTLTSSIPYPPPSCHVSQKLKISFRMVSVWCFLCSSPSSYGFLFYTLLMFSTVHCPIHLLDQNMDTKF